MRTGVFVCITSCSMWYLHVITLFACIFLKMFVLVCSSKLFRCCLEITISLCLILGVLITSLAWIVSPEMYSLGFDYSIREVNGPKFGVFYGLIAIRYQKYVKRRKGKRYPYRKEVIVFSFLFGWVRKKELFHLPSHTWRIVFLLVKSTFTLKLGQQSCLFSSFHLFSFPCRSLSLRSFTFKLLFSLLKD